LAAKFGALIPASSALIDTSSIAKEFAAKCSRLASNSIPSKESARNVMKDMQWSTGNALKLTPPPKPTLAAQSGKAEFAYNAPKDGTSPTTPVSPSVISARHGMMPLEPANPATMATKL